MKKCESYVNEGNLRERRNELDQNAKRKMQNVELWTQTNWIYLTIWGLHFTF
jgi:hypothetical protein